MANGCNYEQIGFYFKYTSSNQETGTSKVIYSPQYILMAESCFNEKIMAFDDSTALKFDGKKWEWFSKTDLHNYIMNKNPEGLKPAHIDQFSKVIKAKCFLKTIGFKPTDGKINVDNGVIDIKSGLLETHNHQYLFKYCIPMTYDCMATAPNWLIFLETIFEGNQELIKLIQKMFGYILMGGNPFLHKAFVLYGTGRNGKSTLLDVLRALVGKNSYSTISMAKLDKEFSLVTLDGKLANIVEETPTDEINSEIFKALVGGGEVQAAHKGFDEFTLRVNARFVFACNDMPVFKDRSIGLIDRLVFIPFNRYFVENERDVKITEKLLTELPGILNWSIEGAKILFSEGGLGISKSSDETKEIYREETDPLYAWFKRSFKVTGDNLFSPEKDILVGQLYLCYVLEMESCGHNPMSRDKFFKRFKILVRASCKEKFINFDDKYQHYDKKTGRQHRAFNVIAPLHTDMAPVF